MTKKDKPLKKLGILDLIIIVLAVSFILFLFTVGKSVTTEFAKNFDQQLVIYLIFTFVILIAILYILNSFLIYTEARLNIYVNRWVLRTIVIMLFLFIIGCVYIVVESGSSLPLELVLRDSFNKKVVGEIKCKSESPLFLIGKEIRCETKPKFEKYVFMISFRLINGTKIVETHFNETIFTPIPNVEYITFIMSGVDENGIERQLEVGNPYKFYTQEDFRERKNKFITFILVLFGIVMFSVPQMMVNFKELSREDTKKDAKR